MANSKKNTQRTANTVTSNATRNTAMPTSKSSKKTAKTASKSSKKSIVVRVITPDELYDNRKIIFAAVKRRASSLKLSSDPYTCEEVLSLLMDKCQRGLVIYNQSKGSLNTFLSKIAGNALIDIKRSDKRYVSMETLKVVDSEGHEMKFEDSIVASGSCSPLAPIFKEEGMYFILQAFREMAKETRSRKKLLALYLLGVENLTYDEIAKRLHIRVNDVALAKTRFLPRLKRLALRYEREDHEGRGA